MIHILVTDGCFYGKRGMFRVAPPLELKKLEAIFQHKVFKILLTEGKIAKEMIAMLSTWRHSGFHVFCGNRIWPDDETAMENLARYIIRASFSQERMHPIMTTHGSCACRRGLSGLCRKMTKRQVKRPEIGTPNGKAGNPSPSLS